MRKRIFKGFAAVLLSSTLTVSTVFAVFADDVDKLKQQKQQTQQELDNLQDQWAYLLQQMDDLELKMAYLAYQNPADKAVQDSFIQFLNRCVPADFPDKASYIVFLFVGTVQEKG